MSKKLILSLLILWCYRFLPAQSAALSGFPRHFTPQEVGKRLAYHFVDGRHDLYAAKYIHYAEVCTWNGALDYAVKARDQKLIRLLQDKFEPF